MTGAAREPKLAERLCVEFDWRQHGEVILAHVGGRPRLVFPKLEKEGGIYRFWTETADHAEVYVGESGNLRQRASTYRNPGSRYTASWVHDRLIQQLSEGAKVTMWLMVDARYAIGAGEWRRSELHLQEHRLLLENAALAAAFAEEIGDGAAERVLVLNRLRGSRDVM